MAEFARRSARVLLLDASDRLLLIHSAHAWFAPGGGVDEGEKIADAAARELREETGLTVAPADLYPVAYTTGRADLGWASGLFRDDLEHSPARPVQDTEPVRRRRMGGRLRDP